MGFYQIVSSLKTAVDMRKKAVSNISQRHDGTIIQPNARIYQELGVRTGLLHAYSTLRKSGCVILPFFKGGNSLFHASSVSSLNSFASVWCCIENNFLAATAEGAACSMRIPVGNEGLQVAEAVHAPKSYLLPCYIGLGYPAKDAAVLEQVERPVKNTLHFGKW